MERFVPFEKKSKRKKREELAKRRKNWGGMSPVTRKPANPKAYKRVKAHLRKEDSSADASYLCAAKKTELPSDDQGMVIFEM